MRTLLLPKILLCAAMVHSSLQFDTPATVLFVSAEPWIAALIALILVVIRMLRVPEDRKRCDWFLAACVLALPANMISEAIALPLSAIRPLKLDQYVYQLDVRLFGTEPAFFLGRM